MSSYKKILAAVDFSGHTHAVIASAISLAEKYNSALTILHVVEYTWPTDTDYVLPPIEFKEDILLEAAHKHLDTLLKDVKSLKLERVIVVGRPKQEVLQMAERESAELIIVGAHGHHGIANMLGSNTDAILHRAPCDVLIVH